MGIYYQDIIKIDGCLYEDIDTALEVARKGYAEWCSVTRSITELVSVFRDENSGDLVIQYKYDDEDDNEIREDRFEVSWVELATTVKSIF